MNGREGNIAFIFAMGDREQSLPQKNNTIMNSPLVARLCAVVASILVACCSPPRSGHTGIGENPPPVLSDLVNISDIHLDTHPKGIVVSYKLTNVGTKDILTASATLYRRIGTNGHLEWITSGANYFGSSPLKPGASCVLSLVVTPPKWRSLLEQGALVNSDMVVRIGTIQASDETVLYYDPDF